MTTIKSLPQAATLITVVAIVAGLGAVVLDNVQTSNNYSSDVNAAFTGGLDATQEATSWLDIIALVTASVVILGLVLRVMRII